MCTLTVSEPWDFEGPRGGNQLNGKVVRWLDSKNVLFEANEELTHKGITSRYWILSTRYVGHTFESMEPHGETVNGGLIPCMPVENEDVREIQKPAIFRIIGSLKL